MKKYFLAVLSGLFLITACSDKLAPVAKNAVIPTIITEKTPNDTDDPAIWIDYQNPSNSLIIGTDKEMGGGLYAYNLDGKIVRKFIDMKRPNNVDIAYGMLINGKKTDIAVATERKTQKIRIFSLPDLLPVDNGGIDIFTGETGEDERDGMGIALYTKKDGTTTTIYAIVGRKTGPSGSYLWQYKLEDTGDGKVTAKVVRKFGTYSGKKEIEAIAVDDEAGFVYYSDETAGVRKYYADPERNDDTEVAFFARKDAKRDHEGIALYKTGEKEGYILVSNQQKNTFLVYAREGTDGNIHQHELLAEIPVSTIECDGADAVNFNFGPRFPNGFLVAMSNGMVFHLYEWSTIQQRIDEQIKK